jgi:hypothetical protein
MPRKGIANPPQVGNLPRMAASHERSRRFSNVSSTPQGRPIANRPQVNNLPHY